MRTTSKDSVRPPHVDAASPTIVATSGWQQSKYDREPHTQPIRNRSVVFSELVGTVLSDRRHIRCNQPVGYNPDHRYCTSANLRSPSAPPFNPKRYFELGFNN
jgi:hypothetical protein